MIRPVYKLRRIGLLRLISLRLVGKRRCSFNPSDKPNKKAAAVVVGAKEEPQPKL